MFQSQSYTLSCTGYPATPSYISSVPPSPGGGIGCSTPSSGNNASSSGQPGGRVNSPIGGNLARNSEAYVWGSNSSHQLAETESSKYPVPIMSSMLKDVQKVSDQRKRQCKGMRMRIAN